MNEPRTVLLVEGDHPLRRILAAGLSAGNDFAVHQAATLGEARDQLGRVGRYDAILLDAALPDGCGLDFCGKLRRRGEQAPVLVIVRRPGEAAQALASGASGHVALPIRVADLLDRLYRHLDGAGTLARNNALTLGSENVHPCDLDHTLEPPAWQILPSNAQASQAAGTAAR